MDDELFNTAEKRENAIALLKRLLKYPGWKLLVKVLDANIKVIEKQVLEGEFEKKEDFERAQDKRYFQVQLRNLPQNLIESLADKKGKHKEFDPYD